ncbi:MAG: hypothetical protein ABI867_20495 [Kofleriaceae bacterium]
MRDLPYDVLGLVSFQALLVRLRLEPTRKRLAERERTVEPAAPVDSRAS